MPPAVPFIAAVGASWVTAAVGAGTFLGLAAGALTAVGIGLIGQKIFPVDSPEFSFEGLPSASSLRQTVRGSIVSARYVMGRARLAGVLHWVVQSEPGTDDDGKETGDERTLHMAFLLSEGPIEAIERMWLDGKEYEITDVGNGHYTGLNFDLWLYGAANGTGGKSLRDVDPNWTADHKCTGISWCHLRLHQPDYGDDREARYWDRVPNPEFLIRGMKVTWPGQTVPIWTENAAALRHWYLTTRLGFRADLIDRTYFNAAFARAAEVVDFAPPREYAGYEARVGRYTINGVIESKSTPRSVLGEMDFAWAGSTAEVDGSILFLPGADSPVSHTIEANDIVEVVALRPSGSLQSRVNAVGMQLDQSRDHDYLPSSLGELADDAAIARDGQRRSKNSGSRKFVTSGFSGLLLLAVELSKLRANATYDYRLRAGREMKNALIVPGDVVQITDPENGLLEHRALCTASQINADLTVSLGLREWPRDIHTDRIELPGLRPRDIDIPLARNVPAPAGLTADYRFVVARDGTLRWWISVTWRGIGLRTQILVTDDEGSLIGNRVVQGSRVEFDATGPGTYQIGALHLSRQGYGSNVVTIELSFDWTDIVPPAPFLWAGSEPALQQVGDVIQVLFTPTPFRDLVAVDLRYSFGAFDSTNVLPVVTAGDWETAEWLDISWLSPITPGQPTRVRARFPRYGRLRIFGRYVNSVGVLGAITEVGEIRLLAPLGVPAQVGGPYAEAKDRSVILRWRSPAAETPQVNGYQWRRDFEGGLWSAWQDIPGSDETTTEVEVPALVAGLTYFFQLRAWNSAGIGPVSVDISAIPGGGTTRTAPEQVHGLSTAPDDGAIDLRWTTPDDGGTPITRYEFQRREGSGLWSGWTVIVGSGPTTRSYRVTGLTNSTVYSFRVRAVNSLGDGPESSAVDGTPASKITDTVPKQVPYLEATQGDREIALKWTSPYDGGQTILRYEVQHRESGDSWPSDWTTIPGGGKIGRYRVERLTNAQAYNFRVRAVNILGAGAASAVVTEAPVASALQGAPGKILSLVGRPYSDFVSLRWGKPPDGGAEITKYQYQQRRYPSSGVAPAWGATWIDIRHGTIRETDTDTQIVKITLSTVVRGLTPGTQYGFRVRAVNAIGNGTPSEEVIETPGDDTTVPGPSLAATWPARPGWRGFMRNTESFPPIGLNVFARSTEWPNDLFPDQDTIHIGYNAWNGELGWPFGPAERSGQSFDAASSAYYDTIRYDLRELRDITISARYTAFEPSSPVVSSQEIAQMWVFWSEATFRSEDVTTLVAEPHSGVQGTQITGVVKLKRVRYFMVRLWLQQWRGKGISHFSFSYNTIGKH